MITVFSTLFVDLTELLRKNQGTTVMIFGYFDKENFVPLSLKTRQPILP